MKKNNLIILVIVVLVVLGLWWYFSRPTTQAPAVAPTIAPTAGVSGSDKTTAINQDLQSVDVGNYSQDLQSIDNNINSL